VNALITNTGASEKKLNGFLVHHVFFWLKEPDNNIVRAQFEQAIGKLLKVETIEYYLVGVPASTLQRDVIDHSYTYSYMLFFKSKADQDIYQSHRLHLTFVDENKHLWEKVIVYDSVDI